MNTAYDELIQKIVDDYSPYIYKEKKSSLINELNNKFHHIKDSLLIGDIINIYMESLSIIINIEKTKNIDNSLKLIDKFKESKEYDKIRLIVLKYSKNKADEFYKYSNLHGKLTIGERVYISYLNRLNNKYALNENKKDIINK